MTTIPKVPITDKDSQENLNKAVIPGFFLKQMPLPNWALYRFGHAQETRSNFTKHNNHRFRKEQ